jgi:hypothetical protein
MHLIARSAIDNLSSGLAFNVCRQFDSAIIALRSRGQNDELRIGKCCELSRRACRHFLSGFSVGISGDHPLIPPVIFGESAVVGRAVRPPAIAGSNRFPPTNQVHG